MFYRINTKTVAAVFAIMCSLVATLAQAQTTGTVTGTVRRSAGNTPVAGVEVALFATDSNVAAGRATTGANGVYTITTPAGSFRVKTLNNLGLIDEMLPGLPCPYRHCSNAGATAITVAAGQQVGGIDFSLDAGGAIAGTVRREGGTPIAAAISAFDATGVFVGHVTTANGSYVLGGLPSGNYFLRFGGSGYTSELRGDVACPDLACTPSSSPPVAVAVSATTSGIDATLSGTGIAPNETIVYLNRCEGDCVIWAGADDSVANTASSVRDVAGRRMSEFGQAGYPALAQCVRGYYARYNLVLVTEDPGNVPHREQVVVQNASQDYGIGPGYDGTVSEFCQSAIATSISLTFAQGVTDPAELCLTSTHEFGHQFALDHTLHAPDVMSHVDVPEHSFTNVTAQCGEVGQARPCRCGGTTQNSDATLSAILGVRGQGPLLSDGFE